MLLVDRRAGSHELVAPLRKMGLEVEELELPFGDVAFIGRGEGGTKVSIGIEFKTLSECVASLRTGRLQGHQLPGMRDHYDFCWLLIEGELLYDYQGRLLRRARRRRLSPLPARMTVGEFLKRILVLHLRGGLNPLFTQTRQDTLKLIEALYRVWTDKDQDQHQSHIAMYQAPTLVPLSEFRHAVNAWPTIGVRTSKAVEVQFKGSLRKAANASPTTWAAIEIVDDKGKTRRIGAKDAQKIVNFLEGVAR